MTLSFSTKWPTRMQSCAGQPNFFINKIWLSLVAGKLSVQPYAQHFKYDKRHTDKFGMSWDYAAPVAETKPKLHTIRAGHRWKPGMKIHPVINNRTANRFQFAPVIECVSVQDIEIKHSGYAPNYPLVMVHNGKHLMNPMGCEEMCHIAVNDGFETIDQFFEYFNEDFEGQIIHWTTLRY